MNLKKIPPEIGIFGNTAFRGKCASETVEQATFFNRVHIQHPKTWGVLALHIKNEGKRHHKQVTKQHAEGGFIKGASDIIVPGAPTFVCEMKRKDHTQSTISDEQIKYLLAAHNAGAFACVALGCDGAWDAFEVWLTLQEKK